MAAVADWKDTARELRETGLSERQIAEQVGKSPSSVHDALARTNGHAPAEPEATPGQQTIDGGEVPPAPDGGYVEELRVDGTTQLGIFDAGGKKPSSASLRLSGGRVLLVDGQAFKKGDVISGSFTAVVREVAQRDKPDPATGIVVSAEQKHVAQITDLTVG